MPTTLESVDALARALASGEGLLSERARRAHTLVHAIARCVHDIAAPQVLIATCTSLLAACTTCLTLFDENHPLRKSLQHSCAAFALQSSLLGALKLAKLDPSGEVLYALQETLRNVAADSYAKLDAIGAMSLSNTENRDAGYVRCLRRIALASHQVALVVSALTRNANTLASTATFRDHTFIKSCVYGLCPKHDSIASTSYLPPHLRTRELVASTLNDLLGCIHRQDCEDDPPQNNAIDKTSDTYAAYVYFVERVHTLLSDDAATPRLRYDCLCVLRSMAQTEFIGDIILGNHCLMRYMIDVVLNAPNDHQELCLELKQAVLVTLIHAMNTSRDYFINNRDYLADLVKCTIATLDQTMQEDQKDQRDQKEQNEQEEKSVPATRPTKRLRGMFSNQQPDSQQVAALRMRLARRLPVNALALLRSLCVEVPQAHILVLKDDRFVACAERVITNARNNQDDDDHALHQLFACMSAITNSSEARVLFIGRFPKDCMIRGGREFIARRMARVHENNDRQFFMLQCCFGFLGSLMFEHRHTAFSPNLSTDDTFRRELVQDCLPCATQMPLPCMVMFFYCMSGFVYYDTSPFVHATDIPAFLLRVTDALLTIEQRGHGWNADESALDPARLHVRLGEQTMSLLNSLGTQMRVKSLIANTPGLIGYLVRALTACNSHASLAIRGSKVWNTFVQVQLSGLGLLVRLCRNVESATVLVHEHPEIAPLLARICDRTMHIDDDKAKGIPRLCIDYFRLCNQAWAREMKLGHTLYYQHPDIVNTLERCLADTYLYRDAAVVLESLVSDDQIRTIIVRDHTRLLGVIVEQHEKHSSVCSPHFGEDVMTRLLLLLITEGEHTARLVKENAAPIMDMLKVCAASFDQPMEFEKPLLGVFMKHICVTRDPHMAQLVRDALPHRSALVRRVVSFADTRGLAALLFVDDSASMYEYGSVYSCARSLLTEFEDPGIRRLLRRCATMMTMCGLFGDERVPVELLRELALMLFGA